MPKYLKKIKAVLFAIVFLFGLFNLTSCSIVTSSGNYNDAILYNIRWNGVLEFNATHSAHIRGAQIIDNTGSGITTITALKTVMGKADSPSIGVGTDLGERTLGKAVRANLGINEKNKIVTLTITDIRERPVVGISWRGGTLARHEYIDNAEIFERNGAFVVYLPQVTNAVEAQIILSKIDGIFMTGGEDWNPVLYNEKQTPHGSVFWNDARDLSDLHMMQQAIAMDVPMLAVCRGHQGFNIAMGGGLIQDIPYYLGQQALDGSIAQNRITKTLKDEGYRKWDDNTQSSVQKNDDCDHLRVEVDGVRHLGYSYYHKLAGGENSGVDIDSKWLYDIIGSTSMGSVHSSHHQAVNTEKLGNGITIVARSKDGIVEAIEHQDSLFALGIQGHPEEDALGLSDRYALKNGVNPDECNAILGALVKYAGIHADRQ